VPVRDLLILGCLLGLRFSDLSRISPVMITDGEIKLRQKKVGKQVRIPILNEVKVILEKYKNYAPNIPLYDFNKKLKDLGKLTGIDSPFEVTYYKRKREFIRVYKNMSYYPPMFVVGLFVRMNI